MSEQFLSAIRSGDRGRASQLLQSKPELASARDPQGISALLTALYHRQPEIASSILALEPELDLFDAAASGDTARVRDLLKNDSSLVTAYSPDGWTALHLAAFFGHPEIVELLLDRGAGIDMISTNMGNTALQAATANGQTEVARALIDRGADVNYAIAQGEFTALHGAANGGHATIAEMLLEAGADPEALTTDGKTARDFAAGKHGSIVALIDGYRNREDESE